MMARAAIELTPARPVQAIAAAVGNTPLVPILRVGRERLATGVEVWAKLESSNPSGSVKDRAAAAMLFAAEQSGRVHPGCRLIEASSGNTAIALAMLAARGGYELTVCLPANANVERRQILRAFAADLVLTSPLEGSDGAILEAQRRVAADPHLVYLDQYSNDANWRAHLETTGPEIVRQTSGRVTHFVAALGTSGTCGGSARALKRHNPAIAAVSVEPDGPMHGLEGLKHMASALVPSIYDPNLADAALGAPTEAALDLCRRLAREEGLFVGPSSGAALWGALEIAQTLDHGVVVTLFPDGGSRYLSETIWDSNPRSRSCP
jgi:cysteine synthase B